MHFPIFTVLVLATISIVRCAPALDAATLRDNAKKAQQLNAGFLTLKATDPCQGQSTACLNGAIATCVNGKLDASKGKCPQGQRCFAIPDVRATGTSLICSSESNVLALMSAAGVTGGITGSGAVASESSSAASATSTSGITSSTSSSATTSASNTITSSGQIVTVTVTVIPSAASTTTTTVSPSDASSILSKFLNTGEPTTSATATSSSTSSSTTSNSITTTSAVSSSITTTASASGTAPTVIKITDGAKSATATSTTTSASATSSSANVIQLTAAQPSSTESASPSGVRAPFGPDAPGSGSGY